MANITFTNNGGIETSGNIDAPSFSVNGKNLVSVVIEKNAVTDSNGERWYRLYSDGWLEQGGRVDIQLHAQGADYQWSTTFLKSYDDAHPIEAQVSLLSGWASDNHGGLESLDKNGVGGYVRTDGGTFPRVLRVYWWAKGYTE